MVNLIKMKNEEILEILKDYRNKSNKDLVNTLDFLKNDFEINLENEQ